MACYSKVSQETYHRRLTDQLFYVYPTYLAIYVNIFTLTVRLYPCTVTLHSVHPLYAQGTPTSD